MIDSSYRQNDNPPGQGMKYCPACGKEIIQPAKYCPYCGLSLEITDSRPAIDLTLKLRPGEQDFTAFVVINTGYYLEAFRKFNAAGRDVFSPTWNWAAFGGGFGWMLYRKMYLWAIVAFVSSLIPYLGLAAWIAFGAVANYLYYEHAKKKILDTRTLHPSGDISVILSQTGGVNKWVPVAAIIFSILVLLLFLALLFTIPFSFYNFFNLFSAPSKYI